MPEYNIAIVDSDNFHVTMMHQNLTTYTKKYGIEFNIHVFSKARRFLELLPQENLDLCIVSTNLSDISDTSLTDQLYKLKLSIPMILCSPWAAHAYEAVRTAARGVRRHPGRFAG